MTVCVKYPSLMKFGTTYTSRISGASSKSNPAAASRMEGSSFQKQQATCPKSPRRRIAAACARLGALESGLVVEPCPTISNAV